MATGGFKQGIERQQPVVLQIGGDGGKGSPFGPADLPEILRD